MAAILGEEEKSHPIESEKDADEDMGFNKLMYDRDIPSYNPRDLEYCKPLADLAIDFYNQQLIGSKQYHVVDLIRVIVVLCSSYYFSMKFTTTVADSDANVITFGAEVYDGIEEMTVESVVIVTEGVTLNLDVLRACARYFYYLPDTGKYSFV